MTRFGGFSHDWLLWYTTNIMKKLDLSFAAIRVPIDAAMIVLAGLTAYWIRISGPVTEFLPVKFSIDVAELTRVTMIVAILWILIFALNKLYATGRKSIREEMIGIIYSISTGMMVVFTVIFFIQEIFESRFIVLAAWVLAMVFVIFARLVLRGLQRWMHKLGYGRRRVVIIGTKEVAEPLINEFKNKPSMGVRVMGRRPRFDTEAQSWIVRTKNRGGVDEIILADPDVNRSEALKLVSFCDQNHINFFYTADLLETATSKLRAHTIAGVPLFEVMKTPLDGWGRIYKRGFDIIVSSILIVLSLPIQIPVIIILLLERQGGFLVGNLPSGKKFSRIGEGGVPFRFLKFRSMIKDAHKFRYDENYIKKHGLVDTRKGSPLKKFKHDPRITPFGKIIRRTSIDEIPQFYLVFIGKMSLIGPRPHEPEEVDKYKPEHKRVLTIKPGITGMAQVSGRSDLDFEDEVRLDVYYIENWSPWLDLTILIKTPLAVIGTREAS